MPNSRILFFLKYPEAGRVKTRLARSVGNTSAETAFRWMVKTCWDRATSPLWDKQVIGTPDSKLEAFSEWLRGTITPHAQPSGSLGDRLLDGTQHAFDAKASKVLCVGGDCPTLNTDHYKRAFEALENHDLVLFPALDGGYVLIGFKQPQPQLFSEIAWSTHLVFNQTLEIAEAAGLSVWVGETLPDIDTIEDWEESVAPHFPDAPSLNAHA
ncbi:MAG: TIGR04282 family arsenosugar biosynthesis glycosyltransferase [Opitutales bacterium]